MAILKIARMGHPVLTALAKPVTTEELAAADVQRLIDDMFETMADERGVGLAAPQVHRSLRLFVMEPPPPVDGVGEMPRERLVLANPVLTFPGEETMELWEGCLSMPGIRGLTKRLRHVQVECLDRHGNAVRLELEGFGAVVVQHETDHLDGILFPQRMPDLSLLSFEDEMGRRGDSGEEDEEEDEGEAGEDVKHGEATEAE